MKTRSRILLAAAVASALFLAPSIAEAQTATANMTVSATVAKSCVVTGPSGPVNFASYDPVSTTQLSAPGTISVRCVRGTGYSIALTSDTGFNMRGTGGDIPYAVLQPDGSTSWTANSLVVPATAITSSAARDYVATVRPAVGVDVPAGSYTDTVHVTVTY